MMRRILGISLAIAAAQTGSAHAVLVLKQVQALGSNQVELQFDRDVDVKAIKTEFYQDIIQLSLNNVSVYPPRIFSVPGADIAKVFAYQYTPKLVRCRLTMKGKAEEFKDRISLRSKGRTLILSLQPPVLAKDKVTLQAAKAISAPQAVPAKTVLKPEDKSVLDKVLKEPANPEAQNKPVNLTGSPSASKSHKTSQSTLGRAAKGFAWMTVVILLMAGLLLALRKALKAKPGSKSWLLRMMKGKLGGPGKLIEVEATHYLGPKKSIAVVKVQGRRLVLGVTEESINLITQLDARADGTPDDGLDLLAGLGVKKMGAGAEVAGPGQFSEILASAGSKPSFGAPESTKRVSSVRDQIRRRVEGLKNL